MQDLRERWPVGITFFRGRVPILFNAPSGFRVAKLWELPVLGVRNRLRRRRLHVVESLDQDGVAHMLLLESAEFGLVIVISRCESYQSSRTNGIRGSVQIRTMSESQRLRGICHLIVQL